MNPKVKSCLKWHHSRHSISALQLACTKTAPINLNLMPFPPTGRGRVSLRRPLALVPAGDIGRRILEWRFGVGCRADQEGRQCTSALNPQPSTINPQPTTLNPQPSTLDPQSSTPTPTAASKPFLRRWPGCVSTRMATGRKCDLGGARVHGP